MNFQVSFGQCITRDSLWKRVNFIRYAPRDNKIDKLKEFFKCKEDVKNCPANTDSVYTLLLNSIGVEYFKRGDYVKAIEYTKKALDIVKTNISRFPMILFTWLLKKMPPSTVAFRLKCG
jgi:tetratricopeptide (TPR) repeat protein